jgi:zinc transport system ATP-binding protein
MSDALDILSVSDVCFSYDNRPILLDVSFSMEATDFVAIIGPNGGGKSTLVKLIMGLAEPQSGEIRLFGQPPKVGRSKVGYLSQANTMTSEYPISVLDVVLTSRLSGQMWHRFSDVDRQDAIVCLEQVGLVHLCKRSLSELSGGERQRVFIARALMNKPKLLILDEPTSSADPHAEQTFYELLQKLNTNMAVLMVSHDISAVSRLVKKVACLNQRLIYHNSKELDAQDLHDTYGCSVELIAHGVPHRVLHSHD